MKTLLKEIWELEATTIDRLSEQLVAICQQEGCDPKRQLRLRLAVENVLLQWWEAPERAVQQISFKVTKNQATLRLN